MKPRKIITSIGLSLLLLGVSVTGSPVIHQSGVVGVSETVVSADTTTAVQPFILLDSTSGIDSAVGNINNQIHKELDDATDMTAGWKFMTFDSGNKKVSLDRATYKTFSLTTRKRVMEIALENLSAENSGGIGSRDRQRLYTFVENQDTEVSRVLQAVNKDVTADISFAMRVMDYINSPVNQALGILTVLACVFVSLQIAIDVFCMATPPVMYLIMNKFKTRPAFISPEAYSSYKESMSSQDYKDYFLSYVRKSIPKLIITGICLAYVIAGNVAYIAIFFTNLFAR